MTMVRRVVFFTISDQEGASARYRVYDPAVYLERRGFEVEIVPPLPSAGGWRRLPARYAEERRFLERVRGAAAVVIQKRLFSVTFLRALSRMGVPLVYDYDDAVFTSQIRRSWPTRRRVKRRLTAVMQAADLVTAGNRYLADYARTYARRVEVVPTGVDMKSYPYRAVRPSAVPVFGWIGSRVNHRYLEALGRALRRLAGEGLRFRVMVVSDGDVDLPGIAVDVRRWSRASEVADLLEFDIGLMPLADDEWTRGKCALKALQYMAAGIPAVCSAVGSVKEIISSGKNGFLCRTDENWVEVLHRLSQDVQLRGRIGAAGRATVAERFDMPIIASRLADLLDGLTAEGLRET